MFVFILSNAGHPLWFPGDAPQKRASGQLTGFENLAILNEIWNGYIAVPGRVVQPNLSKAWSDVKDPTS